MRIVRKLLEAGAKIDYPGSYDQEIPLFVASRSDSESLVRCLVDHGANVNFKCGRDERSALHTAARVGHAKSAKVLLDCGAQIDLKRQDRRHFSRPSHRVL